MTFPSPASDLDPSILHQTNCFHGDNTDSHHSDHTENCYATGLDFLHLKIRADNQRKPIVVKDYELNDLEIMVDTENDLEHMVAMECNLDANASSAQNHSHDIDMLDHEQEQTDPFLPQSTLENLENQNLSAEEKNCRNKSDVTIRLTRTFEEAYFVPDTPDHRIVRKKIRLDSSEFLKSRLLRLSGDQDSQRDLDSEAVTKTEENSCDEKVESAEPVKLADNCLRKEPTVRANLKRANIEEHEISGMSQHAYIGSAAKDIEDCKDTSNAESEHASFFEEIDKLVIMYNLADTELKHTSLNVAEAGTENVKELSGMVRGDNHVEVIEDVTSPKRSY